MQKPPLGVLLALQFVPALTAGYLRAGMLSQASVCLSLVAIYCAAHAYAQGLYDSVLDGYVENGTLWKSR